MTSYCVEQHQPRNTGLESVLSSTDDKITRDDVPQSTVIHEVKSATGAIAYWNDQLVKMPDSSVRLGETDGYTRVKALAAPHVPEGSDVRPIYLLVRDHGKVHWIEMQAYDVQDVCVEGKVQV